LLNLKIKPVRLSISVAGFLLKGMESQGDQGLETYSKRGGRYFYRISDCLPKMNFPKYLICLVILFCKESNAVGYFSIVKKHTICRLRECCNQAVIPFNISNLFVDLESKLFGQHIVVNQLARALNSHFQHIDSSKKPLVMSFHGTTGK
jgi:hypothetical protein